jgi:hypothetical protein
MTCPRRNGGLQAESAAKEKEPVMTLSGNVRQGEWSVNVETKPAEDGGYQSTIHVRHSSPDGDFEHTFQQGKKFGTERDAVLDGLREGMTWIGLKMARTIKV